MTDDTQAQRLTDEAMERASSVFGWQHLARYSGQGQEWLDVTLRAMVQAALAARSVRDDPTGFAAGLAAADSWGIVPDGHGGYSSPGPTWPCANYRDPVICLTAASSGAGRCDWCADVARKAGVWRDDPTLRDRIEVELAAAVRESGGRPDAQYVAGVVRAVLAEHAPADDESGVLTCDFCEHQGPTTEREGECGACGARAFHLAPADDPTVAGNHVRARFATPDEQRTPGDPVRHNPGYMPCGREHDPGRVCLRPDGHDRLAAPEDGGP